MRGYTMNKLIDSSFLKEMMKNYKEGKNGLRENKNKKDSQAAAKKKTKQKDKNFDQSIRERIHNIKTELSIYVIDYRL